MSTHLLLAVVGTTTVWQHTHAAATADMPLIQAFAPRTTHMVNCGGHFAETCRVCPGDAGEAWCHGDCLWETDSCRPSTRMNHLRQKAGNLWHAWFAWLPLLLVTAAVQIIYAAIFNLKVVAKYRKDIDEQEIEDSECGEFRERESNVFSMFKDKSTTLWACFCTPVLAAKNFHVSNVFGYWPSCLLIGFTMYSPLFLFAAIIRTVLSMKLKRKLNLQPSFCKDFLLSLFCFHCEVGRESLEVDEAKFVELSCPFNVASTCVQPVEDVEPEVDETPPSQEKPKSRNCSTMMGVGKMRNCSGPFRGGEAAEALEGEQKSSWFTWRSASAVPEEVNEELLSPEAKGEELSEPGAQQTSWFPWRTTPAIAQD